MDNRYHHQPLPQGRYIRILRLEPALVRDEPIRCSLSNLALGEPSAHKNHIYEALSYVWGSPKGTREILCDGKVILVSENCLSALLHLRLAHEHRVLWIDAICIDQENNKEKAVQVSMMRDVYMMSRQTIVWLGSGDKSLEQTLSIISRGVFALPGAHATMTAGAWEMSDPAGYHAYRDPDRDQRSLSLQEILRNPWFSRAWTFQEFEASKDVIFVYGSISVGWESLRSNFQTHDTRGNGLPAWASLDQMKELSHCTEAPQVYTIRSQILLQDSTRTRFWFDQVALNYLKLMRPRGARDPRDKVFALHGILAGFGVVLPFPDYTKTVAEVYQETATFFIHASRSLRILNEVPSVTRCPGLPSWVPDWGQPNESTFRFASGYWVCPEEQSGLPDITNFAVNEGRLTVAGRTLSTVQTVLSRYPQRRPSKAVRSVAEVEMLSPCDVLPNALQIIRCLAEAYHTARSLPAYPSGIRPVDALSLLLGVQPTRKGDEMLSRLALREFERLLQTLDTFDDSPAGDASAEAESPDDRAVPFLYRLIRSLDHCSCMVDTIFDESGCRFFVSSDGYMGKAYGDPQTGDIIAVARGGVSPLILRPHGSGYRLVSPADIYGLPEDVWPNPCGDSDTIMRFTIV